MRIADRGLFDPRFQKPIHPGGGATLDAATRRFDPVARAALLFRQRFDAQDVVRPGLALEVADDLVAAARQLRGKPAGAPRRWCWPPQLQMRCATANSPDTEQHALAVDIEITPQVHAWIELPEFQEQAGEETAGLRIQQRQFGVSIRSSSLRQITGHLSTVGDLDGRTHTSASGRHASTACRPPPGCFQRTHAQDRASWTSTAGDTFVQAEQHRSSTPP